MLTDFKSAVTEAAEAASRQVADLLQRPDGLDKLDLLRRTYEGKRQRVESRLRSVVQTQLDGVQQGLKDLKSTQKEVQEIKQDLADVEEFYKSCSELGEKIEPIREAFRTQQELSTTYVHLEKIFDVPEAVKRIDDLIQSEVSRQNLLVAHRELRELEHIRDELLIQLYHSKEAYVDQNTSLHRYFEGLIGLKDALGQQLWNALGDTLNLVQTNPTRVVTAMKIVEREEMIGVKLEERLKKDHIPLEHIPGRPVGWRAKVVVVLESSVKTRFERFMNAEDLSDRTKITDFLSDLGRCFYHDLLAAKNYAVQCFPKEYQIFQFYVTQYHQNLKDLVEMLIEKDLDAANILLLMSWSKALSDSVLNEIGVDLDDHGAIVPPHLAKGLEAEALHHIHEKVTELIDKLIEFETKKDWVSGEPPDTDSNGHLCSPLPRDLFEVIHQNVNVMNAIGPDSKLKAVSVCWERVKLLQTKYEEAISDYANDFFTTGLRSMGGEPLPKYKFFMPNIMAAANNCLLCIEYIGEQRTYILQEMKMEALDASEQAVYDELCDKFEEIGKRCLGYLVDLEFENVSHLLVKLCTRDTWLGQPHIIQTVLKTIQEYDEDFALLKPDFHDAAVLETQHRLVVAYGQAMMERRMKVQSKAKDRTAVKDQVVDEARQLSDTFQRMCTYSPRRKGTFLQNLAEIWTCEEKYILPEILKVNKNFEGLKESHILGLLASRGDMNKSKARELCKQADLSDEAPSMDKAKHRMHGDRFKISKRSPLLDIIIKNPNHLY